MLKDIREFDTHREKSFSKLQEVEKSLNTKFRQKIWTRFILALKRYKLVSEGDKIAVCISGGKDSMLLALLMRMLQRFSETKFELVYLCMDPGYNEVNRKKIEDNAKMLEIPIHFFSTNIFDAVFNVEGGSPCYLCARMRRGALYSEAKALGCNKIALAHHFNDVIETTMMGMFFSSQFQCMLPKLRAKNFEGMELIRPMYCVKEKDILSWKKYNGLEFIQCACKFTEMNENLPDNKEMTSMRKKTKQILKELGEKIPDVDEHIFSSLHNISVDTLVGTKENGEEFDFNALYEMRGQVDDND